MITVNLGKIELEGLYRVEVLKASTLEVVSDTGFFKNLITNIGLERIGNNSTQYSHCRVGTSNAAPLPTDTQLGSQIASASSSDRTTTNGVDQPGGFGWRRNVWTFAEGAVVGNVAEVGTGWAASTASTLYSRALVKDAGGTPTTITVLADEILRVTWEIRRYWPTNDVVNTLVNTGNYGGTYTVTSRAANVTGSGSSGNFMPGTSGDSFNLAANFTGFRYGAALSEITGEVTGTSITSTNSTESYVALSHRQVGVVGLTVANGNGQAVNGIQLNFSGASFQAVISPAMNKTEVDTIQLRFAVSWSRRP